MAAKKQNYILIAGEMFTTVPRLLHDAHSRRTGQFTNYFQMNASLFNNLVEKLKPKRRKAVTHMREPIAVREILSVTLRYYTTGHSFNKLCYQFRMGNYIILSNSNIKHIP